MEHVWFVNELENERKKVKEDFDPECTFKPLSFTQNYRRRQSK